MNLKVLIITLSVDRPDCKAKFISILSNNFNVKITELHRLEL